MKRRSILSIVLAVFVLLLMGYPAQASAGFDPAGHYVAETDPVPLTSADFNRNGAIDPAGS